MREGFHFGRIAWQVCSFIPGMVLRYYKVKSISRVEILECIISSKVSNCEEQLWNNIIAKFSQKAGAEPHFTATQPSATQWNKSSLIFQFALCFCAPKFRTSNLMLCRFLSLLYAIEILIIMYTVTYSSPHTVTCLYSTIRPLFFLMCVALRV